MGSTSKKKMKGVILAGGRGERLRPLTLVTNKHLLPVYNKPMILYTIDTLRRSGIDEIMIVVGREHAGHFMHFLSSGREHGVKFSYALQDKDNGGIADALSYAEDFAGDSHIAIILGDNIFEEDFAHAVNSFTGGARVFLKKVKDPHRFGVPVFDPSGKKILRIEEKPKKPKSNFAQTGFYLFDNNVFSIIKTLAPSARGELEITDVNNIYLDRGELTFSFVKRGWFDAGTFESLLHASTMVAKRK